MILKCFFVAGQLYSRQLCEDEVERKVGKRTQLTLDNQIQQRIDSIGIYVNNKYSKYLGPN
jgi:hypothetical protein